MSHFRVIDPLGVSDLKRSTKFYTDLGCEIANDYECPCSSSRATVRRSLDSTEGDDLAADAGVGPEGSGFQGITLNYLRLDVEAGR